MTPPHERSVGAAMERNSMRARLERERRRYAHIPGEQGIAARIVVEDLTKFVRGRQSRYDQRKGGLGKR